MSYFKEVTNAMAWLGKQKNTIFLGQSVAYPGNALYRTLADVPMSKRIEMPVFEDTQMGISIGLALGGNLPISIFPRMDFLICAMNQLVNHLDKLEEFTHGEYSAKIIIRTCVGSKIPLDPGVQHSGDYTWSLKMLLNNIDVVKLTEPKQVLPAYKKAYENEKSTVVVEMGELY